MDKDKFESIFEDNFEIFFLFHHNLENFDYDRFTQWISPHVKNIDENIKRFNEEICKTKKLLSEPCTAYLRHKLLDWRDYLTDTLKHDLEKYEKYKYELLIYFHYLE